ncbi:MAG: hypothetical protein NC209_01415 [Alistipes sp.]|nr:hypothetical protein [Alistipes sp.]
MTIGLYTLTSPLHDQEALDAAAAQFLAGIERELAARDRTCRLVLKGPDFTDFGTRDLDLIYVRTGGTEGLFRELFERVSRTPDGRIRPVRLLTSGKSNSLAASMEILSFLRRHDRPGEIIHGSDRYIAERLTLLCEVETARKRLAGSRLGVIGKPSDWLIASQADYAKVREKLGIELLDIPIAELIAEIAKKEYPRDMLPAAILADADRLPEKVAAYWEGALHIYGGLKRLIERYALGGLTLRCFDLLDALGNTGCLALALLNAEGIPSGCEGDVPALLTMAVSHALTGTCGFQANPSQIDPETGEMLFAHCTVPFDMLRRHSYDTHFESGIGVAIHGELPEGDVTIFKLAGDLSRAFVAEAELLKNPYRQDLCRTQIVLRTGGTADYFLTDPIGNHHVILPGRRKRQLETFLADLKQSPVAGRIFSTSGTRL